MFAEGSRPENVASKWCPRGADERAHPSKSADFQNNTEINRDFLDFLAKIPDLGPNSAILLLEQGINREFQI
jgi:hypothetical protein